MKNIVEFHSNNQKVMLVDGDLLGLDDGVRVGSLLGEVELLARR